MANPIVTVKSVAMIGGRSTALLLVLVLTGFAAAEISGVWDKEPETAHCSDDGCGDCFCCLPNVTFTLNTCRITTGRDRFRDIPAVALSSFSMPSSSSSHQEAIVVSGACVGCVLVFSACPRSPPVCS